MEITEVRIKLLEDGGERLQAFCSITLDNSFVIRDLKIIEGTNGPFVAMPSRKLTAHCPQCGAKNHLRAAYCNQCGQKLKEDRAVKDDEGRIKLYADIAHPINSACRELIQQRVIQEFHDEQERAKQPGYVSRYEDFDPEDSWAPGAGPKSGMAGAGPKGSSGTCNSKSHRPRPPQAATHEAPANFVRPGSEPASQIQPGEQQPRAPHRIPATVPAAASPSPSAARAIPSSATAKSPDDEFGAGIF